MITVSTILPFVGLLAAVVALENVRFANSPANSARLGAEPTKADLWPAAPTMPPHLRFAAIPLKPRDSSQNCGYFETGKSVIVLVRLSHLLHLPFHLVFGSIPGFSPFF